MKILKELINENTDKPKSEKGVKNVGVHETHCCVDHGCKYGNEECPVVSGKIKQKYKCEQCEEITESVVYSLNKKDPSSSEILVKGVGRYTLKTLKQNVRNKLKDLYDTISEKDDAHAWKQVSWMLNHEAMREMVKTIVAAEQELQPTKKKGETK